MFYIPLPSTLSNFLLFYVCYLIFISSQPLTFPVAQLLSFPYVLYELWGNYKVLNFQNPRTFDLISQIALPALKLFPVFITPSHLHNFPSSTLPPTSNLHRLKASLCHLLSLTFQSSQLLNFSPYSFPVSQLLSFPYACPPANLSILKI